MNELSEQEYNRLAEQLESQLQGQYPFPVWYVDRVGDIIFTWGEARPDGNRLPPYFKVTARLWVFPEWPDLRLLVVESLISANVAPLPDVVARVGRDVVGELARQLLSGPDVEASTPERSASE